MALRVSSSLGPLQTQYFVRVSCRRMHEFLLGVLARQLEGADTQFSWLPWETEASGPLLKTIS